MADAIDLSAAERAVEVAMAAPKSRARLTGAQSATALGAPATAAPDRPRHPRGAAPLGRADTEASAHVFDYGVVSILYKLPITPGTALEDLVALAEELFVSPTPEIDQAARRECGGAWARARLRARAAAPLGRPRELPDLLRAPLRGWPLRAQELLARAPRPGAAPRRRRAPSGSPRRAAGGPLSHHSHVPRGRPRGRPLEQRPRGRALGVEDIPDLLEFATAHLLELRYYDALLDRELHRIYDEIEAGGSPIANIFTRRYRKLQRRTAALLLELSEMTERLENAVKIVGDFYLARLYQAAVRRVPGLPAWQETVLRKQRLLAEVNDLIGDAADTSRGSLEVAIILLIVARSSPRSAEAGGPPAPGAIVTIRPFSRAIVTTRKLTGGSGSDITQAKFAALGGRATGGHSQHDAGSVLPGGGRGLAGVEGPGPPGVPGGRGGRDEAAQGRGQDPLGGLGAVKLVDRKARIGRNPATGEQIKIPARTVDQDHAGEGPQGHVQQEGQEARTARRRRPPARAWPARPGGRRDFRRAVGSG